MDTAGRDASGGSGNYLKGHRNEHSSRYGHFRHASELRAVIAQVLGRSECYCMNIGMICFARLMAVDDFAKTGGIDIEYWNPMGALGQKQHVC